jgi:hypothetical protein
MGCGAHESRLEAITVPAASLSSSAYAANATTRQSVFTCISKDKWGWDEAAQ